MYSQEKCLVHNTRNVLCVGLPRAIHVGIHFEFYSTWPGPSAIDVYCEPVYCEADLQGIIILTLVVTLPPIFGPGVGDDMKMYG